LTPHLTLAARALDVSLSDCEVTEIVWADRKGPSSQPGEDPIATPRDRPSPAAQLSLPDAATRSPIALRAVGHPEAMPRREPQRIPDQA